MQWVDSPHADARLRPVGSVSARTRSEKPTRRVRHSLPAAPVYGAGVLFLPPPPCDAPAVAVVVNAAPMNSAAPDAVARKRSRSQSRAQHVRTEQTPHRGVAAKRHIGGSQCRFPSGDGQRPSRSSGAAKSTADSGDHGLPARDISRGDKRKRPGKPGRSQYLPIVDNCRHSSGMGDTGLEPVTSSVSCAHCRWFAE